MTKPRQRIHRDIRRYAHPRAKMEKELTKFQLAAIGAVALAYNEVEVALDAPLSAVVPHDGSNSISREAKIASITKAIARAELEVEDQKQMEQALASFRDFTAYRDASIMCASLI